MRNLHPQASSLKPRRPAVTILEVMFAILVTSIGLLGAVALLPVASYQARRARSSDTFAAAGRAALSRFDAMGMRQPDHWIVYHEPGLNKITKNWSNYIQTWILNSNQLLPTYPWEAVNMTAPNNGIGNPRLPWREFQQYQQNVQSGGPVLNWHNPPARNWFGGVDSFCIDPRFVAANLTVNPPPSLPQLSPPASTFPALTPIAAGVAGLVSPSLLPPFMWRTSLGSGVTQSLGGTRSVPSAMSKVMADSVFLINDDTAFDRANDRAKPATIGFDKLTGAPFVDGKRRSEGHYSWMATLVPERNTTGTYRPGMSASAYPSTSQENAAQTWTNDAYTLSLVVFQDRSADLNITAPTNLLHERLLEVASINGAPSTPLSGLGGGEFLLKAYDINTPGASISVSGALPTSGEDQLKIKRNDWICLGGQVTHDARYFDASGNLQPILVPIFKWYRVVDCEQEPSKVPGTSPQQWERYVSLSGQDWPLPAKDATGSTQITWAIVVDGVVGVYEKSIRLEYDSSLR